MGRQWFASSVRGLGVVASALLLLGVYSVSFAAEPGTDAPAGMAASQDDPRPAPSLDQNFLLLPVFDLQWITPPQQVKVGDRLIVKLQPGVAGDSTIGTPALSKALKIQVPPGTADADDLGFDVSDSLEEANGSFQLEVTALKPGRVLIPSLGLADASGKFIARTNPIQFEAVSAIATNDPKPKETEPPKPPVSLGLPLATLILLGLVVLALIGAGIYALVRWSRNRRVELPAPKEPPKPEDEVALAALAQLEKRGLLRSGQFKAHYFAISEVVKHYLGARYDFEAAESTTHEMLSWLRENSALASTIVDPLNEMFEKLDRVKFTDHTPVAIEGTELLEQARKLVTMTRRLPPVVPIVEGAGNASR